MATRQQNENTVAFDAWFEETMQNADGNFDHLPKWLRSEMRSAWDAGALAKRVALSALEPQVVVLTTALEKIAGSHYERVGHCVTDMDEVPDCGAQEAMELARVALDAFKANAEEHPA